MKTRNPGYQAGNHWFECERCGVDYRANEGKREWTGLVVCKNCWEPRHPQDMVRSKEDNTAAKGIVRPESTEITKTITWNAAVDDSDHTVPTATFG